MTTTNKEPVLVVLQMTGGNDYLNTVVPYTDGMYYDYRPTVGIAEAGCHSRRLLRRAASPVAPVQRRL